MTEGIPERIVAEQERTNVTRTLLLTSAVALLAMAGTAQADIVIGIGTAATGPVAAYGEQTIMGAKQAIADINAKGGVLGQKLELKVGDDACDPRQAVTVANKFATDKIVAVNGHLCSGAAIPANDVYSEEGIVVVTPTATSPKLTDAGKTNVFRVCGRDDQQGIVSGGYIVDKYKTGNVGIVDDKQAYGKGLADVVAATVEKAGVKVAVRTSITAGEKDFSSLITTLKDKKIDVVYYGGYHPELGLIVRQAREQGLKTVFVAGDGLNNVEYWSITGDAGEGTLFSDSPSAADNPAAKDLVAKFKAANIGEVTNFAYYSYAATQVIAEGIAKAGAADGKKIADALHAGTFQTVVGEIQFDKKGDVVKPAYVLYQWTKGKSEVLK
jgi:branched-chain amino acid transport system substrate-binding protein